jgi:phosphatidylglycerophosphate synthase
VRTVQRGPLVGLLAVAGLLAVLSVTVGLGPEGVALGLACGAVLAVGVATGLRRHGRERLGPADWVTLSRSSLSCAVAALVADAFGSRARIGPLVCLAAAALALDAVDGRIARRTRTVTGFGARFDMEADAFLILVLSVYVAGSAGPWVLTAGLARYALLLAALALPWLAGPSPPRYWAKVVAATQGIVLTVAAAEVLPAAVRDGVLVAALLLLAESFARQVWWLARHRQQRTALPVVFESVPAGLEEAA